MKKFRIDIKNMPQKIQVKLLAHTLMLRKTTLAYQEP